MSIRGDIIAILKKGARGCEKVGENALAANRHVTSLQELWFGALEHRVLCTFAY
jgi:hypothetical protein